MTVLEGTVPWPDDLARQYANAGWWRGQDIGRDYYMVTTKTGTRFWLFRRHNDNRWFLHGM